MPRKGEPSPWRGKSIEWSKKHGGTYTEDGKHKCERLYDVWRNMRRRCNDPKNNHYERYGGRGIAICDEWNDYGKFREWAVANGYDESLPRQVQSLDRIDNDKGYSPSNCRWANDFQQANNKGNNLVITCFGETHTAHEWAEITGIPYTRIKDRICKLGWTPERTLSEKRNMNYSYAK